MVSKESKFLFMLYCRQLKDNPALLLTLPMIMDALWTFILQMWLSLKVLLRTQYGLVGVYALSEQYRVYAVLL